MWRALVLATALVGCGRVLGIHEFGSTDADVIDGETDSAAACLVDTFEDGVIDDSLWEVEVPGSAHTVAETGGQLAITLAPMVQEYQSLRTKALWDLRESSLYVEVPQAVDQGGNLEGGALVQIDGPNTIQISWGAGSMLLRFRIAGATDQISHGYDAAERFWRFRFTGTTGFLETSTSAAGPYTTQYSRSSGLFDLSALRVRLFAGAFNTAAMTPGTELFDNLKLVSATCPE